MFRDWENDIVDSYELYVDKHKDRVSGKVTHLPTQKLLQKISHSETNLISPDAPARVTITGNTSKFGAPPLSFLGERLELERREAREVNNPFVVGGKIFPASAYGPRDPRDTGQLFNVNTSFQDPMVIINPLEEMDNVAAALTGKSIGIHSESTLEARAQNLKEFKARKQLVKNQELMNARRTARREEIFNDYNQIGLRANFYQKLDSASMNPKKKKLRLGNVLHFKEDPPSLAIPGYMKPEPESKSESKPRRRRSAPSGIPKLTHRKYNTLSHIDMKRALKGKTRSQEAKMTQDEMEAGKI